MSLPFDISEKLKSVQVRHYVEWLGRDSHCGYGFAFGYDEKSYRWPRLTSCSSLLLRLSDFLLPVCKTSPGKNNNFPPI